MKKICKLLAAATACFALFCSCNDEWEGEQYEKYVSFVKCGVDNAKVYFKYDALGGEKQYRIPVMVSGSSTNNRDVNVVIALDADTLDAYNYSRFQNRTDLYYQLLPEDKYNFPKMSGVIPKGADVGYVDVNFQFQGLDLKHEYILPLQITEASDLAPNPRKYYKKTLMNVVLFNDYSGTYNIAGDLFVLNSGGNKDGEAIMVETRNSWVVDEETIFFYAGNTEETANIDIREQYRIYVRFDPETETSGKVTMWSENPAINFEYDQQTCIYVIQESMDELLPYLKWRYITMVLDYKYDDLTIPSHEVRHNFQGAMTLERKLNILMPEEDQDIFD